MISTFALISKLQLSEINISKDSKSQYIILNYFSRFMFMFVIHHFRKHLKN